MDTLLQQAAATPLLFVGGKGGVGKTTHAAALATRLAESGKKVLLVSTDPAHSLGDVLQYSLSGTIRPLTDNLAALELNPHQIADKHYAQVSELLAGYTKPELVEKMRQHIEAAKSSPGAEEAAILEALCKYITHHKIMGYEHVVFDTAPTGHTLRLLELPQMMAAWTDALLSQQGRQQKLRDAALPFWQKTRRENTLLSESRNQRWDKALETLEKRRQLFADAGQLLADPAYTSIILVMTPEMLPLAETRRALAQLHHFKLPCSHIIVNQIMPQSQADNDFWQQRYQRQQDILQQIRRDFSQVNLHHYALQSNDVRGLDALSEFGSNGRMNEECL
ncbi:ArsA family ATPase [Neisseria weixii]|uniref:ArsA family ATPase n=1 Tax=Neisseria weixii TaxID=1853276 RepID=UPI0035A11B24